MHRFVPIETLHANANSACKIKLCKDNETKSEVVMKVYNIESLQRIKNYSNVNGKMISTNGIQAVKCELQTLRSLNHQSCVNLIHYGEENGKIKLVFPRYRSGHIMQPVGCLSYHPRVPGLSNDSTLTALVRELRSAITYIHSLNMIHLDIKPDNILHDSSRGFALSDFGSARTVDEAGCTRESPATLAFFPPELCQNNSPDFILNGFKADLFAFGLTVWCCLFNAFPYRLSTEDNICELLERIAEWDVRYSDLSTISNETGKTLKTLLAKNPHKRNFRQ